MHGLNLRRRQMRLPHDRRDALAPVGRRQQRPAEIARHEAAQHEFEMRQVLISQEGRERALRLGIGNEVHIPDGGTGGGNLIGETLGVDLAQNLGASPMRSKPFAILRTRSPAPTATRGPLPVVQWIERVPPKR